MKTKIHFYFLAIATAIMLVTGCTDDKPEEINKPVISFDAPEDVYTIKIGESLLLEPTVVNDQNASYRWTVDGVSVGNEKKYNFWSNKTGQFYIVLEVSNAVYTEDKEIRVDVMDYMPPVITMGVPDEGFILLEGTEKTFDPTVTNAVNAHYQWFVNGEMVGSSKDYTFRSDTAAEFEVEFIAENQDGASSIEFNITVLNAADMPFSWEWERDEFNMQLGRTLVLGPLTVTNDFDALYIWKKDDQELQQSPTPEYSFTPVKVGEYYLSVTMKNEYREVTKEMTVNVFDDEDVYLRPITERSQAAADKVWEFLPAPGQFVNEYYSVDNMDEACSYAEERLSQQAYVSLGAFGGYIIVGFDHSIINDGNYNIQILGNSFDGSSEPGVVWVMQDENGDGKPNDTWYELRGSESGKPETLQNYAVTYYKPESPGMNVAWTDSHGNSGTVDYLKQFHKQDYYYPRWVKTSSYTLRGTRLKDKTVDLSGNGTYWYNGNFEWGYADNFSMIDSLTDDDNHNAGTNANHFKISNAMDLEGNPVNLKYIDFVKIQTAVQAKAGWLGELSTEVFGVLDYNMIKSEDR